MIRETALDRRITPRRVWGLPSVGGVTAGVWKPQAHGVGVAGFQRETIVGVKLRQGVLAVQGHLVAAQPPSQVDYGLDHPASRATTTTRVSNFNFKPEARGVCYNKTGAALLSTLIKLG